MKILRHFHLWYPRPSGPDPPNDDRGWRETRRITITYGPLPDIA